MVRERYHPYLAFHYWTSQPKSASTPRFFHSITGFALGGISWPRSQHHLLLHQRRAAHHLLLHQRSTSSTGHLLRQRRKAPPPQRRAAPPPPKKRKRPAPEGKETSPKRPQKPPAKRGPPPKGAPKTPPSKRPKGKPKSRPAPKKKKRRRLRIKLGLRESEISDDGDRYQDEVGWTSAGTVLDDLEDTGLRNQRLSPTNVRCAVQSTNPKTKA